METVFISKLKPFLDAVAEQMDLYVPKKIGRHYIYSRYDAGAESQVDFNNIRTCMPVKEFLFPVCELAAVFPEQFSPSRLSRRRLNHLLFSVLKSVICVPSKFWTGFF